MFPPRDISNILVRHFNIKPRQMVFKRKQKKTVVNVYSDIEYQGELNIRLNKRLFKVILQ